MASFLEQTTKITAAAPAGPPRAEQPDFADLAYGSALGALEAQFAEYERNQWNQTGTVEVVGAPKVDTITVDGIETRRVHLCLDSSMVEVTDANGATILAAEERGTRTAVNVYDLQQRGGDWLISAHSFPNDPDC